MQKSKPLILLKPGITVWLGITGMCTKGWFSWSKKSETAEKKRKKLSLTKKLIALTFKCPLYALWLVQHYAQGGQIKGLVFSVEEGWMDLDGMQSSMKSHLCHRHNILATWDAWGFDVTVPHPARNSIGLAGGSKREEKKMPCEPFSQAEEERLQRLGTQDKDDRSSSRKRNAAT